MEIMCTTDYTRFYIKPGQRLIDKQILDALVTSMQNNGFIPLFPIIVRSDGEIVSGQHRYKAAVATNSPIYFIQNDALTMDKVREIERIGSPKWSLGDFVDAWASLGKEDYIWLQNFCSTHEFSLVVVFNLARFGNVITRKEDLIHGKMVLTAEDRARVLRVYDVAKDLSPFLPKHWKTSAFASAVHAMIRTDGYNHDQMLQRLSYQSTRLVPFLRRNDYIGRLEEIYNYKSSSKNKLRFIRPGIGRTAGE